MTAVVPALSGALLVAGVLGLVVGMRRRPETAALAPHVPSWLYRWRDRLPWRRLLIGSAAAVVGVLVALSSGWWVAVAAIPVAVLGLPSVLSWSKETRRIDRLNALADWVRNLAGMLTVSSGLEGAIVTTVRSVPAPIADEVTRLAARIRARYSTEQALRMFADELDLPTGDLVAATLILATRKRASGVAQTLQGLAEAVAASVAAQRQIEADRAKPRQTVRLVLMIGLVSIPAMLLSGDYLKPYSSPAGQILLALYLIGFAAAIWWMKRLAQTRPVARFLTSGVRR